MDMRGGYDEVVTERMNNDGEVEVTCTLSHLHKFPYPYLWKYPFIITHIASRKSLMFSLLFFFTSALIPSLALSLYSCIIWICSSISAILTLLTHNYTPYILRLLLDRLKAKPSTKNNFDINLSINLTSRDYERVERREREQREGRILLYWYSWMPSQYNCSSIYIASIHNCF